MSALELKELLYTYGRFFRTLYFRFFEDGCTYRAAALSYTSLLSLVPLMTVSFAIFAAFPVFKDISQQIQDFIFSHFVAASGQVIQSYIQNFVAQTRNLSAIGSAFLVVTAVLMMLNMEHAFNAIWRVNSRRLNFSTFLLYWAVLTLSPILIGVSMVMSSYVVSLPLISATASEIHAATIVPFVFNFLFFTLIYVLVPNCYVPIRSAMSGALVAVTLFTFAKWGFTFYVTHFPTYVLLYGALATIPLFLIWVYVLWMIILFGAIISNIIATGHRYRSPLKMDGFTHVFCWLGYFWQALQQGKDLSLTELIGRDSCDYAVDPVQQLRMMCQAGLICQSSYGRYILSEDLSELKLYDLQQRMPWRLPNLGELTPMQGAFEQQLHALITEQNQQLNCSLYKPLNELYREIC